MIASVKPCGLPKFMVAALVLLLAAISAGCAGDRENMRARESFDTWKARAETARGYSPAGSETVYESAVRIETKEKAVPSEVDVKPDYRLGARDENALAGLDGLPDSKITIEMTGADIGAILRALARAAGRNIVISPNVSGKANISAKQISWKEAFASLLRTHGLTYNMIGDTIRIKTIADIQQDFAIENEYRKQKAERVVTQAFFLKYADATDAANLLKSMVTVSGGDKKAGGTGHGVAVDKRNNAVIVHSDLFSIDQCAALLKEIDRPTRQVLIEAHIVETTKDTARKLGVQWGGVFNHKHNWVKGGTEGSVGNTLFDGSGNPSPINPSGGWAANFPAELGDTGLSLGYIYEELGKSLISAELTALEEDGKLNILSSPSITTLDNVPAIIESGRDVPYQTVENDEVNIEWKKAVLSLEVTPHVIDSKTLRVKIKTHKDELDWSNASLSQGNPTIITKNAETDMILFDGQTTVIGGLNKQTNADNRFGVPYLSRIPLLGFLFRSTNRSRDMEEVMIFITPHILEPYVSENSENVGGKGQ
ncbi:MAG: hypothetical protein B5M56_00300 [Desulfococcus sp. 4484_241]|nr:MAG: hypothetical protein B5M56_00300 [Desulfococcus sp. 4484_241]